MNNTASERLDPEPTQSESVVRSAGVVSVAVFMSRITGLLRESVMARLFGAGLIYDAFMLGFRIPNLTRDLFAEGALSSAFVPTFSEYLSQRSTEEAARLVNLVATALIIVVGAVCAAGMIFAPVLVHLLAPGFAAVPGKFELAVRMTRIMFPFLWGSRARGFWQAAALYGRALGPSLPLSPHGAIARRGGGRFSPFCHGGGRNSECGRRLFRPVPRWTLCQPQGCKRA